MDSEAITSLHARLYPAYRQYMAKTRRELARAIPTRACKKFFLRNIQMIDEASFERCLVRLAGQPSRLARLAELIEEGLQGPSAQTKRRWDAVLAQIGI